MNESMDHTSYFISRWTYEILIDWGLGKETAMYINVFVQVVFLIIILYFIQYITKLIIKTTFNNMSKINKLSFFRLLINNKFPVYISLLIPYIIVRASIPAIFADFPSLIKLLNIIIDVFLIFLIISIIMSLITSGADILKKRPAFRDKPMTSYLQVIKMILYLIGLVTAFSIITGKSPTAFFAAMGAASAILMLMFKDTIMGFVASIQVTTNDMVRIGDWITVPKYGADGDVIEINLTTVKVQNFDKTITTMPTYILISDSFQNWRGMQMAGGRRIKRSINIKQSSIRFINDDELPEFKKIQGIKKYIEERQAEIKLHNEKIGADRSIPVNGRNLTNAGLFRKYIEWYLVNHPGTKKDMTLMVRQLAPTERGIPFELYVFTNTTQWINYEYIMADIFDHLIASVKYFDLEIFEEEAGGDKKRISFINPISVSR